MMDTELENGSLSSAKFSSEHSFEEMTSTLQHDKSLLIEEDHFSLHSDIDFLDDIDMRSNLNREEQLEWCIARLTLQLNSFPENDAQTTETESADKRKQLVKRICDLKVKLAKLREEEEFEYGLKELTDDMPKNDQPEMILFFKRNYSFSKHIAGHRLVLSSEIYENEKRVRNLWRNQLRVSQCNSPIQSSNNLSGFLSQSLPTSRLLQLMSNTSSHLSYLTTSWVNTGNQATNPFAQLVCDQCLKPSSKSLNHYLIDAFKFTRRQKEAMPVPPPPPSPSHFTSDSTKPNNNAYLVCIYCFYTIHLNCSIRITRKCPKLFFDETKEEILDEKYGQFYNAINCAEGNFQSPKNNANEYLTTHDSDAKSQSTSLWLEGHQKRMRRVILKICPEIGLSKQEFRCADCRVPVLPSDALKHTKSQTAVLSKARLCDYTGLYFCESCHLGDTAIIPARVFRNWDFTPYPVSRVALQIISYLKNTSCHFDRPMLFNLMEVNPMLYGLVDELIQIKRLRTELCQIYKYISLCKQPSKPRNWIAIMCQLGTHLLNEEEISYLSFTDLCDLKNLANNLSELENLFINHITTCESCQGKGFFCELCPNKDDILFPFSPNTTTCAQCHAIFHKNCYFRRNRLCPRCNRIKGKYEQKAAAVLETTE